MANYNNTKKAVEEKAVEMIFHADIEPTILNLEFVTYVEGADLTDLMFSLDEGAEFTFFRPFISSTTFERVNELIQRDYNVSIPETIELDSDSLITISIGRRLSKIYYFVESRYDTYSGTVFARPVFERGQHYPNTIFVYLTTPRPSHMFVPSISTGDATQFNTFNNIPFEIWAYDGMQTGGLLPQDRPFQRNRIITWPLRELDEPFHSNVQSLEGDRFLRRLPTRNSRVETQLIDDHEFEVTGYWDDGESIDGNSRWYYVRTNPFNRVGFIHSSVIGSRTSDD